MFALRKSIPASIALLATGISLSQAAPTSYPKPDLANVSTGFFESKIFGRWYRGSGVIARDPKLIFSCAHVFYESGTWATDYYFYPKWHARNYPKTSIGKTARGFLYFGSYSTAAEMFGSDSNRAFAADFTVFYGNGSFGPAMPVTMAGGAAVRSSQPKRIVGYPSEIDFTGANGHVFQHSTGWFENRSRRLRGAYHEFKGVSTGPGNSGGPIFVEEKGKEVLAGILVSGWTRLAGVRALDLESHTLSGYALGLEDKSLTFRNKSRSNVPEEAYLSRSIEVSGFDGSLRGAIIDVTVRTANRGELDVYLRSPAGKISWIAKRNSLVSTDLVVTSLDLSNAFAGTNPNGTWRLFVRDAAGGAKAVFEKCSLTVSAL